MMFHVWLNFLTIFIFPKRWETGSCNKEQVAVAVGPEHLEKHWIRPTDFGIKI